MKILILALSGIGDALMFTPALKLLKENFPEAKIDALVMFKGVKDIFERNNRIDNVHYYNFVNEGTKNSFLYLTRLRKNYDVSINVYPSNRKEYNIFSYIISAKKRTAVEYLRQNNRNFGFLNNITIKENDSLHNVEENIRMIEKLTEKKFDVKPPFEFPLLKEDIIYAEEYYKKKNILDNQLVIGFHPGCAIFKNHTKRRWEPEKFAELAEKLIKEYKAKILIFGGPDEAELKKQIADEINLPDVIIIETENLVQTAALMKRCNLFITNDSSLMHVASALQLDVVAILGPTNKNYIFPWQTNYKTVSLNLECSPCFYYSPKPLICSRKDVKFKCIKELSVEMVFSAAIKFLKKSEIKS